MNNFKDIINYTKNKGFSKDSRVLNVTHIDLDGIVSTINLMKIIKPENFFYLQKNYDNINEFFTEILFKNNCIFKNIDFVLVTDLSVNEEVIEAFKQRKETLIILDHHETAYPLNEYENCHIDDTNTKSGADVTLDFIKAFGYDNNNLDKLNRIATQFDLFLFKTDKLRRFKIGNKKYSLAELLNTVYFKTKNELFIERWKNGWGKGFNDSEIELIKVEYKRAQQHLKNILKNELNIQLDDKKVLILSYNFIVPVAEYFLDEKHNDLVLTVNIDRSKISGRVNDNSKINIGKIFKLLCDKCDYVTNGGGHEKAGGCGLTSIEFLDDFVENVVKLSAYYK